MVKIAWYWQKNRHIQITGNRTENPEISSPIHGQLIYNKGAKNIKWKKLSLINGVGKTRQPCAKGMKLDHYLISYVKMNSKWIKDLNVRPEAIKLIEENTGSTLLTDVSLSNILMDISSQVSKTKAEINE